METAAFGKSYREVPKKAGSRMAKEILLKSMAYTAAGNFVRSLSTDAITALIEDQFPDSVSTREEQNIL